ncbi:plastocyanin/azurin family copper-binding protein [Candidatus Pelagibacter bacterium nBUS_36]|jgi:pseudoazurin|uniref:plastocyanin/azurin family copper-binding protein n=2 Tax=Candidatus Pelagibacter TaxID=198251 RepID=UPI003EC04D5E|tara:strand:- start:1410 stop:1832 length:423 start_codon:yes stop_codon:yes gene_type:complete
MKKYILILFLIFSNYAMSEEINIKMLNKLDKERMVYSKKIININVGDKVFWESTDKGHNVEFIKGGVPDGVEKFKSRLNEDVSYEFTIPGIYAYWCTPHKSLGMIGFVIVGDDRSNLDLIKKIRFFGQSKKLAQALIDQI